MKSPVILIGVMLIEELRNEVEHRQGTTEHPGEYGCLLTEMLNQPKVVGGLIVVL